MGYLEDILGDSEKIIFTTRHHWIVIIGGVLASLFLAIVIVAIAGILTAATNQPGLLLLLLLLILPLGRLATTYIDWWNEQFLVSNRRIIQIRGFINKHVIDSSLEKVNDVMMDQSVVGRMLGYGDIEILTASDIGINKLHKISKPIQFKTSMLNAKESMVSDELGFRPAAQGPVQDEQSITELITELAGLRDKGLITEDEFQAKKKDLMARL